MEKEKQLDSKKWKQHTSNLKKALKESPKNEHSVYYVNFREGILENKVDLSETENVLPLVSETKKTRKKRNDVKEPS